MDGAWLALNTESSVEIELPNHDRRFPPTSFRRREFGDLCLSDFDDNLISSGRKSFAHLPKSAPKATTAAMMPTLQTAASQRCLHFPFVEVLGLVTALFSEVVCLPETPKWTENCILQNRIKQYSQNIDTEGTEERGRCNEVAVSRRLPKQSKHKIFNLELCYKDLKMRRQRWPRERQKSNRFLMSKTTLHVHYAFLDSSLSSLNDYNVKMPNFTFYGGRQQATTKFSCSLWTWLWFLGIQH